MANFLVLVRSASKSFAGLGNASKRLWEFPLRNNENRGSSASIVRLDRTKTSKSRQADSADISLPYLDRVKVWFACEMRPPSYKS